MPYAADEIDVVITLPQAEFDQIFGESGVPASLERLDLLVARQPELPDGSRLYATLHRLLIATSHPLAR